MACDNAVEPDPLRPPTLGGTRVSPAHPIGRDLVYAIIWLVAMLGIYLSFYFILQQEPSQKGVLIHLLNLARLVTDAVIFLFAAIWLRRLVLFLRKTNASRHPKAASGPGRY